MATYNFTDSWDTGEYSYDGTTYTFSNQDYFDALDLASVTTAINYNGDTGYLYPTDSNGDVGPGGWHSSNLISSFGSDFGSGELDLLNYVDFDLSDDDTGEWQSMIDILGEDSDYFVGGAAAIDATGWFYTGNIEFQWL